jgi:hypothetical protein
MKNMFSSRFIVRGLSVAVITVVGIVGFASSALAQMSVPANLQAALFKKIFSYNKTLVGKGAPKVLVVFTDASSADKDEILEAFKGAGVTVSAAKSDAAAGQISANNIVYITTGASGISAACSKAGVFTISSVASYVEGGKVCVGVSTEGGKPKIIVNVNKAKEEGQDLSADLLKIAKVIQ